MMRLAQNLIRRYYGALVLASPLLIAALLIA